jgi:hypothetical protein
MQDDGSLNLKNQTKYFNNFKFHTEGFSVDDIESLIKKLKTLGWSRNHQKLVNTL